MTDFEIQRRLREMNAPREPDADLWPGIASRIAANDVQPMQAQRRRRVPLALAAAALLAVVAGSLVLGTQRPADMTDTSANALPPASLLRVSPRDANASSRAPGGDPRLLGAAVVLDAAHAELQQALEQRPDAVFLVSLLNRTNARRMKLDHFGTSAG